MTTTMKDYVYVELMTLEVDQWGRYTLDLKIKRSASPVPPRILDVRMLPDDTRESLLLWLTSGGPAEEVTEDA